MLKADPTYPTRRTYVLKLRSDATLDAFCGRLENLVACQHHDFSSVAELLQLITRDMESAGTEPSLTPIADQTPTLS